MKFNNEGFDSYHAGIGLKLDKVAVCGETSLSRLSGYAIVQEGSEDLGYTAKVFYFTKDIHECKVHFTVSLNTPWHITVSSNS